MSKQTKQIKQKSNSLAAVIYRSLIGLLFLGGDAILSKLAIVYGPSSPPPLLGMMLLLPIIIGVLISVVFVFGDLIITGGENL